VVLDDADLDEAVKAAAFGAFISQGQICMSTERIIVVESVADALIDKSAAKAASMPVGYGRFGGRQGIDSFTETRWITIESQPGHYPI
jgi:benzaldehyde dehydrogenase (NAD)